MPQTTEKAIPNSHSSQCRGLGSWRSHLGIPRNAARSTTPFQVRRLPSSRLATISRHDTAITCIAIPFYSSPGWRRPAISDRTVYHAGRGSKLSAKRAAGHVVDERERCAIKRAGFASWFVATRAPGVCRPSRWWADACHRLHLWRRCCDGVASGVPWRFERAGTWIFCRWIEFPAI